MLRLRQICLAAPRLEPLVEDLQAILGLAVCHRDPGLAAYGLHNALLPLGSDFLEVVTPLHAGTAAGRFIQRSQGHGGYMAIFQTDDPAGRQRAAAALGVRTAHQIDHADYQSVQLHPRDCRAAFIELGHSRGGEARDGCWWPAGPHWQDFARQPAPPRLLGLRLESPDPAALARWWAAILRLPLDEAGSLRVERASIGFEQGAGEALGSVVLAVADPAACLQRAVDCGLRVELDQRFHLGGVYFQLLAAEPPAA